MHSPIRLFPRRPSRLGDYRGAGGGGQGRCGAGV